MGHAMLDLIASLEKEAEGLSKSSCHPLISLGNPYLQENSPNELQVPSSAKRKSDRKKKKEKKKKKKRASKRLSEDIEVVDPSKEKEDDLKRFFGDVRESDSVLHDIREYNEELRDLYIQLEGTAMSKDKKRINKDIDSLSGEISVMLDQVRVMIENLGIFVLLYSLVLAGELNDKNTQVDRIKRNTHRVVSQNFFDLLQEFYGYGSFTILKLKN